ncbi:MAG TPA: type II toxin-antitoxin system RelE/ParE family toxin [Candidatus Acidoferrales bacterium]|nr:type II toxin-antitoxin system RelE/ParE family toxin [Candidatus Acidoferrales bacterium]
MTLRKVVLHPAAVEEAEAAARWYRERSPRATGRFIDEINQVIDRILAAPQRWPQGPRGTRKVKLPCFPFLIIYRERGDTIQILAVAHGHRRPGYWKDRR